MQPLYKENVESNDMNGPVVWSQLDTFTSESLNRRYPSFYERMQNLERPKKKQLLIYLDQLEAFSTLFVHGNIDKKLGNYIGDPGIVEGRHQWL